jgi:tetratricopeptide (TPR) repeat protein
MTGIATTGSGVRGPDDSRDRLSTAGRRAAQAKAWPQVEASARALLGSAPDDAEGYFLLGLAAKGRHRTDEAIRAFARARELDTRRYDATVELAGQQQRLGEHGEAVRLLRACEWQLGGSPYYLDMAATIHANAGLPGDAWRLFGQADALQPDVDALRARFAAACVHVGRTGDAVAIYEDLLRKHPEHQRNHYELSRLRTATDRSHIDRMLAVLERTRLPPARNIYLCYALGKEFEDLGEWSEAFRWYRAAGDAAADVADYDVADDLRVIDAIIETCNAEWLRENPVRTGGASKTPIFVVGLPRSGTTLVERVLASHPLVSSAGESFFVPSALRQLAGERGAGPVCADVIRSAARAPAGELAARYLAAIDYRLGDEPMFVEKLPENVLYLGFLARDFPDARIVHVRRNPMDVCFAMYKQSFFRYAYTLADLGRYYPAYDRLAAHWSELLADRIVSVSYETLVGHPEAAVRTLLARLGLPFEPACLEFHRNPAATNTASAAQVREPMHTRSVGRWRHFAPYLEPLAAALREAGIDVTS